MTLFKSMWKAVVLVGIAGVLGLGGIVSAQTVSITTGPINLTVGAATGNVITATPSGFTNAGSETYAWYYQTTATPVNVATATSVAGTTNSITISTASAFTTRYYFVVATDETVTTEEATSATTAVTVSSVTPSGPTVSITTGPINLTVGAATGNVITATPSGFTNAGTETYAWYYQTTATPVNVATATSVAGTTNSITISTASAFTTRYYFVVATDGTETTEEATSTTTAVTVSAAAYVAVTNITGVPTTGTVGTALNLASATVTPNTATNSTIAWTVQTQGTTGASWSTPNLTATSPGAVVMRATITNGLTASTPYVKDFTITFNAAPSNIKATLVGYDSTKFQVNRPVSWVVVYKAEGGVKFAKPADGATCSGNRCEVAGMDSATALGTFGLSATTIPQNGTATVLRQRVKWVDSTQVNDTITGTLDETLPASNTFAFTLAAASIPAAQLNTATTSAVTVQKVFGSARVGFRPVAQVVLNKGTITQAMFDINEASKTYNRAAQPITKADIVTSDKTTLTAENAGALKIDVEYHQGSYSTAVATNEGPVNAGTYLVQVTASNKFWTGTWTSTSRTYRITPKEITAAMLTVGATKFEYRAGVEHEASFSVKDGNVTLTEGVDYDGTQGKVVAGSANPNGRDSTVYADNDKAGKASVSIKGINNYQGVQFKTFDINRQRIYIDAASIPTITKAYDGTTAIDTATAIWGAPGTETVRFNNAASFGDYIGVALDYKEDYTVVGDFLSGTTGNTKTAAVADAKRANVTIKLVDTGTVARNYTLVAANLTNGGSADVAVAGSITKATPAASHFVYDTLLVRTVPGDTILHRYTGRARGVGNVTWKTGLSTTPLKVLYDGDTTKPVNAGTYVVSVTSDTGVSFTVGGTGGVSVSLGSYTIGDPAKPVIDAVTPDTTVRQGVPLTLSVKASPAVTGGSLSYQWYRDDAKIATNGTGASLSVNGLIEGNIYAYKVIVTNTKSAGAAGSEVGTEEKAISVTVIEPPTNLSAATVQVFGSYTYTGSAIAPPVDSIVVFIPPKEAGADTTKLVRNEDYTVTLARNINVGSASVSITGVDKYIGIRTASFPIVKKKPDFTDLTYVAEVEYNAKAQPIAPVAYAGTGLGAVSVKYDNSGTAPTNAGTYVVTADIAEGTNYTAATNVALGFYTINKKIATDTSLIYTKWKTQIHIDSIPADGIGAVTLPGTGYKITVTYSGSVEVPTELGVYNVAVIVEGDPDTANYDNVVISLGTFNIVDVIVSVAQNDRVIPGKGVTEEAAIAPVKVIASSFAVGPNVVSKSAGKVTFFSGRSVKSGSLYVFDANGNAVAKIAAKQVGKEVATWNLKSKGAAVAEGTYVVKGALVGKDGTKEKVSSLFTVTK